MASSTEIPGNMANKEQRAVIDAVKKGENVFITGGGGTGKSFVVKKIVAELGNDCCKVVVCPTHHAAAVFKDEGATTYHKFFKCYDEDKYSTHQQKTLDNKVKKEKLVLIFDEISMLSASRLDFIDLLLRSARKDDNNMDAEKPFGGAQAVFVGDFYQIPPIMKSDGKSKCPNLVVEKGFAFEAHVWEALSPKKYELTLSNRLNDSEDSKKYFDILKERRVGIFDNQHLMQGLCASGEEERKLMESDKATWLYVKNVDVKAKNEEMLGKLEGAPQIFSAFRFLPNKHAQLLPDGHKKKILDFQGKINAPVMLTDTWNCLDLNGKLQRLPKNTRGRIVEFIPLNSELIAMKKITLTDSSVKVHKNLYIVGQEKDDLRDRLSVEIDHLNFIKECIGSMTDFKVQVPKVRFDGFEEPMVVFPRRDHIESFKTGGASPQRGNGAGGIMYLPLCLGWAMTIHKSQGISLDEVIIDAENCFVHGMGYVALSRPRDPSKVVIVSMPPEEKPNSKVTEFMSQGSYSQRWTPEFNPLKVGMEGEGRLCTRCGSKSVICEAWFNDLRHLREELTTGGLSQDYKKEIDHLMLSLPWMGYRSISSLKDMTPEELEDVYNREIKDYKDMLASHGESSDLQASRRSFGEFDETPDFKANMRCIWRKVPSAVNKILPSTPVTTQETPSACPRQQVSEGSPAKKQKLDTTGNEEAQYYVYVLALRDDKFYVGITTDIHKRIKDHSEGKGDGAEWTRKHPLILDLDNMNPIEKFGPYPTKDAALREENYYTVKYMEMKDIDNVRGGDFANIKLSEEQKKKIENLRSSWTYPPRIG